MDFQPIFKKALNAKIKATKDISAGIDQKVFSVLTDRGKFVVKQGKKDDGVIFRQKSAYEMLRDMSIPIPKLRYISEKLLIEDFVEGETLSDTKKDRSKYFQMVGGLLKKLHAIKLSAKNVIFSDSDNHLIPLDIQKLVDLNYFPPNIMNSIINFFRLHKPKSHKFVFLHGDLADGHIIIQANKIAAIIDWGDFGTGLPEYDFACMFIDHIEDGFFEDLVRGYGKVDIDSVRYFAAVRLVWKFVRHFKDPNKNKKLAKIEKLLTTIILENNKL